MTFISWTRTDPRDKRPGARLPVAGSACQRVAFWAEPGAAMPASDA